MATDWLMIGLVVLVAIVVGWVLGTFFARKKEDERVSYEREDAISRSRSVLTGQMSEQIAPFLPDFPYKPTEVKFLGKPIDFIAFKGLDDVPSEIVFVEVKTGKSKLNANQQKIKQLIKEKKVSWEEYRPMRSPPKPL
ncbi:MAG: Holliday junction resolvase-like protein [Candidatus Woesearchaeota archaeon]|jgi:predicted Holliday junction resolvase-like endonuclease|nr:Holliday junction resolvase-like protein [Candidatus Woesearchaeota archaeon]MDP7181663.1 Holliday junction resolvase-like protein [Candidatus Woesearchaeota archaeon]MDP7198752.1 Holliday junction resolvase-like protein [Candidatus Woesearchaeota archaeon]MDP7467248.1 Holliday junction resolvase-like protein [Candidatus Woesearchaeota archaeon]MDP7647417.1 Holliday junction resolvase-like protein [Candidatus Woesearchaeota archaeon]